MNRLKRILRSKTLMIFVSLALLYTLAGFFLAPYLIRHFLPKIVGEKLGKQAAIGEVRLNPYAFTLEADDFRMEEPDGQAIAGFRRLIVDFELKSLFNRAWTFRRVSLEAPAVNVVIAKDGALNLAGIAPPASAEAPPAPAAEEAGLPALVFEEIAIDEGRVDFEDRRQSRPASVKFHPLKLEIRNLSTLPKQEGPKTVVMKSADGETLRWSGRIGLNPVASKGTLAVENLRAATLWKFARDSVAIEAPSGKLDLSADYDLDLSGADPQMRLANLTVALNGLALKLEGAGRPFVELPALKLDGGRFDLNAQQLEIGKLSVAGGKARVEVGADGLLNLERIAKASAAPAAAPAASPKTEAAGKPWRVGLKAFELDGLGVEYADLSRAPGAEAAVGRVKLGFKAEMEAGGRDTALRVEGIALGATEIGAKLMEQPEPMVRIDALGLEGGAYDLGANGFTAERIAIEGGAVDLRREADGTVNLALLAAPPVKGEIARETAEAAAEGRPLAFLANTVSVAGLKAAISDLGIKPDGPLLNLEDIAVTLHPVDGRSPMRFEAGLVLREGGRIRAAGNIDPAAPAVEADVQVEGLGLVAFQPYIDPVAAAVLASGAFSTQGSLRHGAPGAAAQTTYQGGFRLEDIQVKVPGGKEVLVGWKSVATDQLALQVEPNKLEIGDLRVHRPVGKFVIEKDRSLNLARLVKSGPQPKKPDKPAPSPAPASADPFPYRVKRILVSEGEVDFADFSLPTPFGTRIHELKGVVAGISSTRAARAQVKLDGRVDDYGTAKVDGELNTSDPKAFTDIGVVFRNVEMSRLTPYSGKFAGRKINSGKLSVDLKYKIDKSKLAGDNKLVVNRLVLGEKVPSPEAVDLPLDLAIALLEDSNGVIDLGLPVSGNLDSPEFSYGALVGKAIVNLLTKIVTSPFRALGALLPGGGEEAFNAVAFEPGRPGVPPPEKEKLLRLAGALQKRPQLKLSVQGRYAPDLDRAELRTAALQRAVALKLGQKPGPGEEPGPVDFSSPEAGKALEALFAGRFGAEALKSFKDEQKAMADKAKAEAAAKGQAASAAAEEAAAEDPGRAAKLMFERLAEVEPVEDAALAALADARAQAVLAELSGPGAVPAERIAFKPSAAMEKNDPPAAALSLEVGK
jgi:hypothetical protein